MTLPILAQTAKEADPRRNYRMRDFLETLGLRPVFVPDPGPVAAIEAAPATEAEALAVPEAPEGESGSEDGSPAEAAEPDPAASPLAPPAPYGHQSIADAVAAKDEPAEADDAPDPEAAK
jgi:hypothetical protein